MSYLESVKRRQFLKRLSTRQGWKDDFDGSFVYSGMLYTKNKIEMIGESPSGFEVRGAASAFARATGVLDNPDLAAHAFTLLLGFAAPLIKFTGIGGIVASPYSMTGDAKLMTEWMMSIWGNPEKLALPKGTTAADLFGAYGFHGNLPIHLEGAFDDATSSDISRLINDFERGSGKATAPGGSGDMPIQNWSSILVVPTKNSTTNLVGYKVNKMRDMTPIFDYALPHHPDLDKHYNDIKQTMCFNHGAAGDVFIQNLVSQKDRISLTIGSFEKIITENCNVDPRYGNLIKLGACVYAAGYSAGLLGLVNFDMAPVHDFIVSQIKEIDLINKKADKAIKSNTKYKPPKHSMQARKKMSESRKKFIEEQRKKGIHVGRPKKVSSTS